MAKIKEDVNETNLVNQYGELAMNRFKWNGLPEEIPLYLPEQILFSQGQCVVFKLPGSDTIAITPVAYGSVEIDIYGRPSQWRPFAVGKSPQAEYIRSLVLNNENSVLIWNNSTRTGDTDYIRHIVHKMIALDKTLECNCLLQRTPIVFAGNKNNRQTAINVLKDINDGKNFIFDSGVNVGETITVVNLNVPFIGAELSDQYETYHHRILRYLGIDFLPVEKQERMLTGEVSGNDNETVIRREINMKYREDAAKAINKLFGLNVTVEFADVEEEEPDDTGDSNDSMSGTQNGPSKDRESGKDDE